MFVCSRKKMCVYWSTNIHWATNMYWITCIRACRSIYLQDIRKFPMNTHQAYIMYPQTEEIGLQIIKTAKIFAQFSQESPYISNTFSREYQIFIQVFACVHGVPVTQKTSRAIREISRSKFLKFDLLREWIYEIFL